MAEAERGRLRLLLGEVVPLGGTEADTNFTDAQLDEILLRHDNDMTASAREGWAILMAQFAHLVDTSEGGAKRAMSDLHKNAVSMWQLYGGGDADEVVGEVSSRKRVRIHRISRGEL